MIKTTKALVAFAALSLVLAACGTGQAQPADGGDAAGAACLVGDDTCYETGAEGNGDQDAFDAETVRQEAHGVLGMYEKDLPESVRVARRGAEQLALTEDYVLGRLTVELDDTDGSGFRVTTVTVELPDGPETFELTPG